MKKHLLTLSCMLVGVLISLSAMGQKNLTDSSYQILTGIRITDHNDQPFTAQDPPNTNSNVRIYLDWQLNHTWGVQAGDYYIYAVPHYFGIHNTVNGELIDEVSNINYGTFHLASDGKLTITFNSNAQNSDVTGKILLETSFNQTVITKNDTIKTGITDEFGTEILIIIGFKEGSIQKTGELIGNYNLIKWTITINNTKDLVSDAMVIDTIPEGLFFSFMENSEGYDFHLNEEKFESERKRLVFTWDKNIDTDITFSYYTFIINPAIGAFTNIAHFSGSNILPTSASASLNVNSSTIDKRLLDYDATSGEMNWEIQYYANTANASVIDQLWKDDSNKGNHYLLPASLQVSTVDAQYQWSNYNDWSFDSTGEEKMNGNIVKFKVDLNNPTAPVQFMIRYTTQAAEYPIVSTTSFQNKVTADGKNAWADNKITITSIKKAHKNTNYADSTHQWTTIINDSKILMKDLILVDTFQTAGMTFVPNSLIIEANSNTLTEGSDYTVAAYDNNYQKGFVVTFLSSFKDTKEVLTLVYKTKFDINAIPAGTSQFTNVSIANFKDSINTQRKESALASASISSNMRTNGAKAGKFIPRGTTYAAAPFDGGKTYTSSTHGSIIWNVMFNYNMLTIKDAVFTDALRDKQQYASGTLQVWAMKVNSSGSLNRDSTLKENIDYVFTHISGNSGAVDTVKIVFKKDITSPISVYFITTLDNSLQQQESYKNTAELISSSHNNYTWSATVQVTKTTNWVQKTGRQGDEANGEDPFKIYWSVLVNKDSAIVADAVVKDSLDSKQKLATLTNGKLDIKVYKVKMQGTDFVKDESQVLAEGVNYTVNYSGSGTTGAEKFIIKFIDPNPISQPYIIEYQSHILVSNNDIIKNNVSFTGVGLIPVTTTETITIKLTTAKGLANGQTGSITINKIGDANNDPLDNAVFELYSNTGIHLRTVTTGEDGITGEVSISNLNFGIYKLKEIVAPAGHRLDTTIRWSITINNAHPHDTITITNILKSSEAQVREITVNGNIVPVESDGVTYNYTLKCGADTALAIGVAEDFGTIWFTGSNEPNTIYFPSITKAGLKVVPFKVVSEDSLREKDCILNIYHPFEPDIVVQLWGGVLTVNNNSLDNGGYSFVDPFQWFKNGMLIPGENTQTLYVYEKLNPADAYHTILTTTEGWSAPSCPMHPVVAIRGSESSKMAVYPNPAASNQILKLQTGLKADHSEKATLYVYDLRGKLLYIQPVSGAEADIKAPANIGNYLLKLQTTNGVQVFNLVVTR